jgi:hypothetical protein
LTLAQYLSIALNIGLTRRDALLTEIATVHEIYDIRERAYGEARRRGSRT